ncbi:hypothetical protein [Ulvibacterium marinum]|uniref:hypothetical protein n=1 Tax=Ulvibacterium marinum TaxID=2419782 RepID=UPI001313D8B0|nr:hypothetical protein [Ulvibacterium marinum]
MTTHKASHLLYILLIVFVTTSFASCTTEDIAETENLHNLETQFESNGGSHGSRGSRGS